MKIFKRFAQQMESKKQNAKCKFYLNSLLVVLLAVVLAILLLVRPAVSDGIVLAHAASVEVHSVDVGAGCLLVLTALVTSWHS